jgi:hypothetical protein
MLAIGTILAHPCPECGGTMVLRASRFGPFYGCKNYPRCTASHGAHKKTGKPLGTPADKVTKQERIATHAMLDPLWNGMKLPVFNDRREAYRWMAEVMGMTADEAHIGRFDAEQCKRLRGFIAARFPHQVARTVEGSLDAPA